MGIDLGIKINNYTNMTTNKTGGHIFYILVLILNSRIPEEYGAISYC